MAAVKPEASERDVIQLELDMPIERDIAGGEDARDIVKDAFTIALVKLDSSFNPTVWLIRVADFLAINMCRKAKRRAALLSR